MSHSRILNRFRYAVSRIIHIARQHHFWVAELVKSFDG